MLEPHSPVQHCTVQYCTALYCTSPAHNCTSACTGQVCSHVPGVNKFMLEVTCFAPISTAQRDRRQNAEFTLLNSSESCNN